MPPRRPLIWPWLLLLLLLVGGGIAAAFWLTRDGDSDSATPDRSRSVTIIVSTAGPAPRAGTVPSVVGATQASAQSTLEGLGYRVAVRRVPSSQPRGLVVSQVPGAGTRAAKGALVRINVSEAPPATTESLDKEVPDVRGLAQRVAVARLQSAGFKVDAYPAGSRRPRGTVIAQRPAGGTRASPGSVVRIDVALGSGRRPLRTVPDVVGMTEARAKQALVQAGFTMRSVDTAAADSSERDLVLDQRPAAGATAPAASQVILSVGRFPPPTN